ncbi:hypothetical protein GCM10009304_23360 [Pseudomonas matsuisoli]|uniref:YjiS-like domain-containing protein n=2 Tax=Pseudomonas matsuisoli TaxID=1515666 RepID=A0A917UYR9_9PSED|nr:hypothetical protein GCM10009304_23360 [Pseudomonas matsuisoli]
MNPRQQCGLDEEYDERRDRRIRQDTQLDADRSHREAPDLTSPASENPWKKQGFWQRLRQRASTRRALLNMDDATLKDIGLTREQALKEALVPIWRLFR